MSGLHDEADVSGSGLGTTRTLVTDHCRAGRNTIAAPAARRGSEGRPHRTRPNTVTTEYVDPDIELGRIPAVRLERAGRARQADGQRLTERAPRDARREPQLAQRVTRDGDRRRAVARLALLGLAIAGAFVAVTLAGIGPSDAQRWIASAGPVGPVVFVLAAGVLGLALFPGHVSAIVAGMLFGALAGTALALAAAVLGAALCVTAARWLGSDAVHSLLGPRGRRWQTWLAANGFSAVLACRLAPGTPSGLVNYLAGLAGIRPRALLGAVVLGALPKTVAYVALGGALSDPLSSRAALAVALYVGAAAGGALIARRLIRSRPHRDATAPA
jgi:uncharacterized membrane protein YdjX (TVP38/TMEM64 family)